MEELGIGRPSTYASTITTILARHYVIKENKNLYITELGEAVNEMMKEAFPSIVALLGLADHNIFSAFRAGDADLLEIGLCIAAFRKARTRKKLPVRKLGEAVNEMMKEAFPSIVDVNFTVNMEALLDSVEEGSVNWSADRI